MYDDGNAEVIFVIFDILYELRYYVISMFSLLMGLVIVMDYYKISSYWTGIVIFITAIWGTLTYFYFAYDYVPKEDMLVIENYAYLDYDKKMKLLKFIEKKYTYSVRKMR